MIVQDRGAFIRLIGLSAVQSLLSAVLAPSLRFVTDSLALAWRRRLTGAAHRLYLKGNTFYTTAQLAGLQVLPALAGRKLCSLTGHPDMLPVILLLLGCSIWRKILQRPSVALGMYMYSA